MDAEKELTTITYQDEDESVVNETQHMLAATENLNHDVLSLRLLKCITNLAFLSSLNIFLTAFNVWCLFMINELRIIDDVRWWISIVVVALIFMLISIIIVIFVIFQGQSEQRSHMPVLISIYLILIVLLAVTQYLALTKECNNDGLCIVLFCLVPLCYYMLYGLVIFNFFIVWWYPSPRHKPWHESRNKV